MGRLLLILINIVFLLVGLALTVVGFILRFGRTLYDPFLVIAKQKLKNALASTSIESYDVDSVDIGEILEGMAIGLIVGGIFLVCISFFGCCGACCKSEILLWLYAIVLIVIFVAEAVAIGLLYGKPDLVKDNAKKSVKDFKGLGSSEVISVAWNILMIEFKCCGVNDYTDFTELATNWDRNPNSLGPFTTPVACCKTLPSGTSPSAFDCAKGSPPDSTDNNAYNGCYDSIWKVSFGNTAIAVPVLVGCGIIQLLFIVLAIYIVKQEQGNKVSPI